MQLDPISVGGIVVSVKCGFISFVVYATLKPGTSSERAMPLPPPCPVTAPFGSALSEPCETQANPALLFVSDFRSTTPPPYSQTNTDCSEVLTIRRRQVAWS